jgi:hypothetical protein
MLEGVFGMSSWMDYDPHFLSTVKRSHVGNTCAAERRSDRGVKHHPVALHPRRPRDRRSTSFQVNFQT